MKKNARLGFVRKITIHEGKVTLVIASPEINSVFSPKLLPYLFVFSCNKMLEPLPLLTCSLMCLSLTALFPIALPTTSHNKVNKGKWANIWE